MAAQELALLLAVTHQQQQMPVSAAHVHHLQLDQAAAAGEADVEELAPRVRADIDPRSAGRRANELEPSPDRGETPLQNLGAHSFLSSCR